VKLKYRSSDKYKEMKEVKKHQNQKFFEQLIRIMPEYGIYFCPETNEVYNLLLLVLQIKNNISYR
jgi:hypothetical protein